MRAPIRHLSCITTAAAAVLLLPASAHAAPPPATADYTAADLSATNHQWYVTGTTTTATTIATGGTVTFNYPTGNTRHNVNFTSAAKPTSCVRPGGTPGAPPVPATASAPPWSASCTFNTPGTYTFNCQLHPTMTGTVNVVGTPSAPGGSVPATLSLSIGTNASLGTFQLGLAHDYTADLAATVTETAADATLSVADPSATAPGHLVNGGFALAKALQIKATNAANPGTAFAAVPGAAAPLTLLTWGGPVSNDAIDVALEQTIGATDPLRTGAYAKSLTFTLSTTNP